VCVYYHAKCFRSEAFQDLVVRCGNRAPELDTVSPDRFEDGFVQKETVFFNINSLSKLFQSFEDVKLFQLNKRH
jgi:hypothetical protein